ncbi:GmrSD restriction endonuclease domain-containing protein [Micromonospora sp. CPCC 205556]|uniref:GmrSD restriction endonuclease domain-containing protein n=1 Tax=Micromonospora sp. CPCC 205556 TaxID=3122398 RepID=UPI002FF1D22D
MSDLTSYPIRKLLDHIYGGQIRIPAFQRGFVWDADHVAHFLDSIYKGYPFGSLLFWLTQERLTSERKLGPFTLPAPQDRYPITYVLDGQQRVTSLFVTFQTEFVQPHDPEWRSVYFDLSAPENVQQSQFVALRPNEVDQAAHFPLNSLFDSVSYRLASARFVHEREIRKIDRLHSVFKEAQLPIQMMETEDRATVAIVFERINRMGVELTTLELLSAWTWSEEFDLRNKLEQLQEELEDFAFGDIGADPNLVLRCCAAILKGDPSVEVLMNLDGTEIRDNFERVENGIKGAIEFLKKQLKVATIKTLPYPLMLVPLSVYFAVPGAALRVTPEEEVAALRRWFWRSCFSERYSGQSVRAARADVVEMQKLREGAANTLGHFAVEIGDYFFLWTDFRINSAKTATFVTMLAQLNPRSFISGNFVDLDRVLQAYNKAEFHHIFPRAFVENELPEARHSIFVNSLANFCFLSRADNNKIRASAPSEYRKLMPKDEVTLKEILDSACVSPVLFADDFEAFIVNRTKTLIEKAYQLCGIEPESRQRHGRAETPDMTFVRPRLVVERRAEAAGSDTP